MAEMDDDELMEELALCFRILAEYLPEKETSATQPAPEPVCSPKTTTPTPRPETLCSKN